ncbi:transposase, IS4 [Anopheles sinensis]|uniref:Transposase, IS4 n=1 Tax=Anopheles sinensis TaxID=74873 RepID=A0A084VVS8_ANOSI|nr:transposase, IS4 [Anopheles sinensis]
MGWLQRTNPACYRENGAETETGLFYRAYYMSNCQYPSAAICTTIPRCVDSQARCLLDELFHN